MQLMGALDGLVQVWHPVQAGKPCPGMRLAAPPVATVCRII